MENNIWPLDKQLLEFRDSTGSTPWTIGDSFTSVNIFGSSGSGKSSSSFASIALKFLNTGYGGLILSSKPSDAKLWKDYCARANRTDDLIIVSPGGHRFNFLEYLSETSEGEAAYTQNITHVLKTVINAEKGNSMSGEDPFWQTSLDILMHNVIDLCLLAYGKVTVEKLYGIVTTLPKKDMSDSGSAETPFMEAFTIIRNRIGVLTDKFEKLLSPAEKKKYKDAGLYEEALLNHIPELSQFRFLDQFFVEQYRSLSDRTRSIIDFSFSSFLFHLLKEPVYSLFSTGKSTFRPEDSLNGKIILIDLPIKKYNKVGTYCQVLCKYLWQLAMEKRNTEEQPRPVFLMQDEAQLFLHEHDSDFLATARSSRVSTIMVTQSLHNYYAKMGGTRSEHLVKSFLANVSTMIFHNNSDITTNRFASDLVGQAFTEEQSASTTISEKFSFSRNKSFRLESVLRPEAFTRLKTGRSPDYESEAYVLLHNKAFHDGFKHRKITFNQVL